MSKESLQWLNENVMVGFGHQAWHMTDSAASIENHYPHAIPAADVARRLFSWDAVPARLQYTVPGAQFAREIEGRSAWIRSDNGGFLGINSDGYGVHQFADSLLAGAERITGSGLGISSAGLLKGGAVAWLAVSLADTTVTAEGVEYLPYLLCYGSHDGSLSTGYRDVVTNVVCDNTMGAALDESGNRLGRTRVRHTRHSAARLESAQDALARILQAGDTFAAQVKALCETHVDDRQWSAFLAAHVPIADDATPGRGLTLAENKREALHELYVADARCAPWTGTAWGVVQTVNTYAHHVQTVRGAARQERNMLGTLTGAFDAVDSGTLATLRPILANV